MVHTRGVGNRPVAVVRLPDGGWAVKEQAEAPPVSVHSCQSVAQAEALKLAREKGELVVVCDHHTSATQ